MEHIDASADPGARESTTEESLLNPPFRRKGRAERMWKPVKLQLTADYKYITHNILWVMLHYILTWAIFPAIYLVLRVRWGFRVRGRSNLKTVRGRAAVTVSNHVHDVDALMVTAPFWPKTPYIVARKHNLEVFLLGIFNRSMRAVPLPEDVHNFRHFRDAMNRLLTTTKHRLHLFPEGEILPYARELRRFGTGAFHFAITSGVPVVPMVFVSPARGRLELQVGTPIEPDEVPGMNGLSDTKRAKKLAEYTKERMQEMLDNYYKEHGEVPR